MITTKIIPSSPNSPDRSYRQSLPAYLHLPVFFVLLVVSPVEAVGDGVALYPVIVIMSSLCSNASHRLPLSQVDLKPLVLVRNLCHPRAAFV